MARALNRSSKAETTAKAQAARPEDVAFAWGSYAAIAALAMLVVLGPAVAQDPPPIDPPSTPGRVVAAGVRVELERDSVVNGHIHSNGDVTVGMKSEVDGDVTLVGTLSNSGTILGTVTQVAPESLPAIPTESEARALADRIFEQDTSFTDGRIDDVVFVAGTARLSGAVLGTGTVIATQDVVLGPLDIALFEPPNYPVLMSLVAFQNVAISGPPQAAGTVLAGQDVTVDRNAGFNGMITAHGSVLTKAGSMVAFESFDDTPPAVTDVVPADGAFVATAQTEISAGFADDESGVNPQSVVLVVDGVDRTAEATVTADRVVLPPGVTLADGAHTVDLTLGDFAGNTASTSWSFVVDTVPPTLAFTEPVETVIVNDPTPRIVLAFADATSGLDPATFTADIDGLTITADCVLTASEASCAPPELPFAVHTATAEIRDLAGHQATATLTYETRQDLTAPDLALTSPTDGALLSSGTVQVTGTVTDDGVVASVLVNGEPATLDAGGFTAAVELPEGSALITATAEDWTGKQSSTALVVTVDTTPPTIVLDEPAGNLTNTGTTPVAGRVTDASAITSVTVAGDPVVLTGDRFEHDVSLAPGQNVITVEATDAAGHVGQAQAQIEYLSLPEVTITSPADLATLAATTVTVQGTIEDPTGTVDVNGTPATVQADGTFVASGVPLIEGGNVLTATLQASNGTVNTASIHVVRDLTPPRVEVTTPADGATVQTATVSVSGLVNDIVAGTVNAQEATVTVNGVAAVVSNRSFLATGVPLALGENVLTAVAVDESGNVGQGTARVVREDPEGERIEVAGGDLQQGTVRTLLPQPLQAVVRAADGTPLAGRTVLFEEVSGGGQLDGGARRIAATTDAAGLASAQWTLGRRAGTQQVRASAVGVPGAVTFTAMAGSSQAAFIVVDAGGQQVGTAGQHLPRPLIATVTDDGFNRLGGVPVEWTVVKGQGHFGAGETSMIVQTDSDGRTSATLVLDPTEGVANNVVTARIAGLPDGPFASFTASGRAAGPAAETAVTGVVLDNTSRPIEGVTVRIDGTALVATTDAEGQFRIDGAPVGEVLVIVDGSTAARPGVWASLEFRLTTIAGRDNDLGMPIFLLPLDVASGLYVDETTGGVLSVPDVPGLSLEIEPGSVTFPGGSKSGVVSMTVVHSDRIPMVPNFGQQPRLIVTIQPAGARFDPPARITYPNVEGLAPGETTDLYSFDHSLGHFVSIGPGTVSDDGTMLVSDPGVGIIKAGWHCGGDPQASTGSTHDCGQCLACTGPACVPRENLTGTSSGALTAKATFPCDDKDDCTVNDHCVDGRCAGDPVKISSVDALANNEKQPTVAIEDPVVFTVTVVADNCPSFTARWTFPDGTVLSGETVTKTFPSSGYHTVNVEVQCGKCPKVKTDKVEVIAVKLKALKVVSGASTAHVAMPDNWVALKSPSYFVNIMADLDPPVGTGGDLITWSGGDPVPGNTGLRQVHRRDPRKETVSATLGPDTEEVDIWITWATIGLNSSGTLSGTNGVQVPIQGFAFPKLGALTDENNFADGFTIAETSAHVEVEAIVEPAGIHQILDPADSGWRFRQWVTAGGCENGNPATPLNNSPDDPNFGNQDVTPQSDDKIYFIDGPTLGLGFQVLHTAERYRAFLVRAEWDGDLGSDDFFWSYFARVDDDLDQANKPRNQDTVLNQIAVGVLTFPQGCYFSPRP